MKFKGIKALRHQGIKAVRPWRLGALVPWCLLCVMPCLALENPEQKVSEVIRNYVLAKYPAWSRDEIRVTFKLAEKNFDLLKTLADSAEVKILEVYPEFKPVGNVMFPLSVRSGDDRQKMFLRAKVEVVKEIAASARFCRKGKVLEEGDLKLEKRDIALLPQKYFTDPASLVSKEAKISIPANSTIFEWMVGEPPLVRRGDEIAISVAGSGMTVRAKGEALEDGWRGGEVRVKRKGAEKVFSARVVSAGEVEVKL